MSRFVPIKLLLWAVLFLALPAVAFADTPIPAVDYKTVTEDGQYVFVMLVPDARNPVSYGASKPEIRKQYSRTGLYNNDGSTNPLWTVDWYGLGVVVSSDGRHIMRW